MPYDGRRGVVVPETAVRKSEETVRPRGWGHAVLKVRELLRSELFYTEVIGFRVVGRRTGMTFLSLGGQHHDLALHEAGAPVEEWSDLPNPFDRARPYDPGVIGSREDADFP